MKNKWRNYAIKEGKVKSSYIREYCNRSKKRKAAETSDSNSVQQSRQVEEEIRIQNENIRKEDVVEAYQQRQQGIQEPTERRPAAKEADINIKKRKEVVKEKVTPKERKHEAKESKSFEKKEDKQEVSKEKKGKKK